MSIDRIIESVENLRKTLQLPGCTYAIVAPPELAKFLYRGHIIDAAKEAGLSVVLRFDRALPATQIVIEKLEEPYTATEDERVANEDFGAFIGWVQEGAYSSTH